MFITEKMTEKSRIKQIIDIDTKECPLNSQSKMKIMHMLEGTDEPTSDELEFLIEKKEKENQKKKRISQLETQFEKKRQEKSKKISLKLSHSQAVREQSLREKTAKNKRNLDHFQKVKKKNEHNTEEQLERQMKKRKQYDSENEQIFKAKNDTDFLQKSHSGKRLSKSPNLSFIHNEMEKINLRIGRAKTNQLFYQNQIVNKIKDKARNFDQIIKKVRAHSVMEESDTYADYYSRATHMIECQHKVKSQHEKHTQKKRKSFDEKIKKCHQNLKHLQSSRDDRIQALQNKFDKNFVPRTWKNEKNQVYFEQFMRNTKRLSQEKSQKAESVISKHLEISLKNRVYKQKKAKIIQAVKSGEC